MHQIDKLVNLYFHKTGLLLLYCFVCLRNVLCEMLRNIVVSNKLSALVFIFSSFYTFLVCTDMKLKNNDIFVYCLHTEVCMRF